MPIIKSLLDLDFYKYTMCQSMFHQCPGAMVKYKFCCRTKDVDLASLIPDIQNEVLAASQLQFTKDELDYMRSIRFFKPDYIEFLRNFRLNEKFVKITKLNDKDINIYISGPAIYATFWEIFLLEIISELYYKKEHFDQYQDVLSMGRKILQDTMQKIDIAPDRYKYSEFGSRRRFSFDWQEEVLKAHMKTDCLVGTSNVYFAMKYGLTPIGTQAHEWFQMWQAITRLQDFQKAALDAWAREYRGDLGIALTDTIGIDAFLNDFDLYFAKLFDGVRNDSGDPFVWGEKMIEHYQKMKIDPKTKTLIFSNSLDIPLSFKLTNHFKDRINVSHGIGTNLTCNMGIKPLNIVIKMVECNGQPVAKLSDDPGKGMCEEPWYVDHLKKIFKKS